MQSFTSHPQAQCHLHSSLKITVEEEELVPWKLEGQLDGAEWMSAGVDLRNGTVSAELIFGHPLMDNFWPAPPQMKFDEFKGEPSTI